MSYITPYQYLSRSISKAIELLFYGTLAVLLIMPYMDLNALSGQFLKLIHLILSAILAVYLLNNFISLKYKFLVVCCLFIFMLFLFVVLRGYIEIPFSVIGYITFSFATYRIALIRGASLKAINFMVLFSFILLFIKIFYLGVDPEEVFNSSRNAISLYVLQALGILLIFSYFYSERLPYLALVAGLALSIIAQGRSGIISLVILFIFAILHQIKTFSKSLLVKNCYFALFVIVLTLFVIVFVYNSFLFKLIFPYFYTNELMAEGRITIIKYYVSNLTFFSAILGQSSSTITGSYVLENFGGNLHNTYLQLHSQIGLLMIYPLYQVSKVLFTGNLMLQGIMIAFLVRILTDSILGQSYMIVFYMLFFVMVNGHRYNRTNHLLAKRA